MSRLFLPLLCAALSAGCVSQSKYAELESMYDQAVADRDQAAAERDAAKAESDAMKEKLAKRTEAFASVYDTLVQIRDKKLAKVRVEDGRAVLQLQSDILFASGKADLTKDGKAAVQEIAKLLAAGSGTFQVEGHTDTDKIASKEFPSNWHLGAARAINVTAAMIEAGMPSTRISAASFGDTMPVAGNDTPEGKTENRRIELVWVPELTDVLPLKKMLKDMKKEGAEE